NPREPSFLRLLRMIVDGARAGGRWVGVCGEMAGDAGNLPLMIGLGVNEISAAPGEMLALKMGVRGMDSRRWRELVGAAAGWRSAAEVEALLAGAVGGAAVDGALVPLLDEELVEVDCDLATKEEAIKAAVDLLFVAGRTERPREVEEAVWAREE